MVIKKKDEEVVIKALTSETGEGVISETISNEFEKLLSEENSTNQKKLICKFCGRTNEDVSGNRIQLWKTEEICMDCAKTRLCLVCKCSYDSFEHNVNCKNIEHR